MVLLLWISGLLNVILVGEKLFSWTPRAKRAKQIVEVVNGDELRVPWHHVAFDKTRKQFVIPNWGTTAVSADQYATAKRSNSGWFMTEISGVADFERNYIPIGYYPL